MSAAGPSQGDRPLGGGDAKRRVGGEPAPAAALDVPTSPWPPLLPWQQDAAATLLAGRATWPHAILLDGPRGIGKRVFAQNLARSLLCEAPDTNGFACGEVLGYTPADRLCLCVPLFHCFGCVIGVMGAFTHGA